MVDPSQEIYGHPTTLEYWDQHMDRNVHRQYRLQSPLLDVGCGTGEKAVLWALDGWSVAGFDISEWCIKIANQHRDEARLSWQQCAFAENDARYEWPYVDNNFCSLFCSDVLEHVQMPDSQLMRHFFNEAHRVLVPGGRILIIVPQGKAYWEERHVRTFSVADMQAIGRWNLEEPQVDVKDERIHLVGHI